MTCIKTGAVVYFESYGVTKRADVYEVGNARIVRTTDKSEDDFHANQDGSKKVTHVVKAPYGIDPFHRPDIGVFVYPATHIVDAK